MLNIHWSHREKGGKVESKDHKDQWYPSGQQCVLSLCSSCTASLMSPSRFQGYPGEKGSSDIINFNGKLLDALRVSEIKASAIPASLTASLCAVHHQLFITLSDRSGADTNKSRSWKGKLGYLFFTKLIHIFSWQAINTVTISVICGVCMVLVEWFNTNTYAGPLKASLSLSHLPQRNNSSNFKNS